jgi:hypothetical protein
MIKSPDLPNAPMTRWVMYLTLFEFEINHVPAEKHLALDGLSHRKQTLNDSDEEDAEAYLDKFIGAVQVVDPKDSPLPSLASRFCLSLTQSVIQASELHPSLMSAFRPIPQAPFGTYNSPTSMSSICNLDLDENDDEHDDLIRRIRKYNGFDFDPAFYNPEKRVGSLLDHTLIKSTDSTTYTGHEFEDRNVPYPALIEVTLGDETFEIEVVTYRYEYMSGLREGESSPTLHDPDMHPGVSYSRKHPTSRRNYEDVEKLGNIRTITHIRGRQEGEPKDIWEQILRYLKDDKLPAECNDVMYRRKFLKRTRGFIVYDERLWKTEKKGRSP